ncbi:MAG: glycosyltransferase family 2 protein [Gallionella sp.]|nr:glycosyltransferase family 2 protein [Gallionella sp.]
MKNDEIPLVSIITPVFNGEKYLRRTIESVLSQGYPGIEYIVVDGASTDNTLNVLESYGDEISLIISEPDSGMYEAINKGMRRSSGQILCYLNADDYFFPDTIKRVVDRFLAAKVELVFGNCIYVDENEHELYRYSGVNLSYSLIKRLGRIPFAQQTAFWTRELYVEVGGFDQRYKYVADTKFFYECLRLVGANKSHINEFLSMFRQHDEAFSKRVYQQMAIEHDLVLSDLGLDVGFSRYLVEAIVKGKNYRNFIRRLI